MTFLVKFKDQRWILFFAIYLLAFPILCNILLLKARKLFFIGIGVPNNFLSHRNHFYTLFLIYTFALKTLSFFSYLSSVLLLTSRLANWMGVHILDQFSQYTKIESWHKELWERGFFNLANKSRLGMSFGNSWRCSF